MIHTSVANRTLRVDRASRTTAPVAASRRTTARRSPAAKAWSRCWIQGAMTTARANWTTQPPQVRNVVTAHGCLSVSPPPPSSSLLTAGLTAHCPRQHQISSSGSDHLVTAVHPSCRESQSSADGPVRAQSEWDQNGNRHQTKPHIYRSLGPIRCAVWPHVSSHQTDGWAGERTHIQYLI